MSHKNRQNYFKNRVIYIPVQMSICVVRYYYRLSFYYWKSKFTVERTKQVIQMYESGGVKPPLHTIVDKNHIHLFVSEGNRLK